jgi:hypothetical protein
MLRACLPAGLGALALAALLALLMPPTAPAADGTTAGKGGERLSNERTVTRWAHPVQRAPIRKSPTPRAHHRVRTHMVTEDGFPEVYLVLRRFSDSKGRTWLKVRIPMRPNGLKGWVRDSALGPLYRVTTRLVVDRRRLRATLYRRGHKVWKAPVGIGAPSTPTPPGNFWIREKFKTRGSGGIYGPAAFGTSDYSVLSDWPGGGVIGIHGTNAPGLIPGRPSHGCIRLKNGDIRELWHKLPIGTPVTIR